MTAKGKLSLPLGFFLKTLYLAFALCCLCSSAAEGASIVEHLYEENLLVLDQSESARQKSLREGLTRVIVRISGQSDLQSLQENSVIQEALASPDAYLQQFSYLSLTDAEKADIKAAADLTSRLERKVKVGEKPSTSIPTIKISAYFSPSLIKGLLSRAGLPIWSTNRLSVLVWVAVDGSGGKQMLSQLSSAQDFLVQESKRRGLPIVLPMNDLTDQVSLGMSRLWDMDQEAIAEASQRYGEDSILVGRVSLPTQGQNPLLQGQLFQGQWLYLLKGQSWLIESTADDLESFLAEGINIAAQQQVQRYGISPTSTVTMVKLDIAGIDSLKRYAAAIAFLKNLDPVTSLDVSEVKGEVLHCTLGVNGDSRLLQELIALGDVLQSDAPLEPEPILNPALNPAINPAGQATTQATAQTTAAQAPDVSPQILHYHFVTH